MAKAYFQDHGGKEIFIELSKTNPTTIGRNVDSVIYTTNPSVSRNHSKILWDNKQFVAVDLASSNGTFVNNKQVDRAPLKDKDVVRCGHFVIRFEDSADMGAYSQPTSGAYDQKTSAYNPDTPPAPSYQTGTRDSQYSPKPSYGKPYESRVSQYSQIPQAPPASSTGTSIPAADFQRVKADLERKIAEHEATIESLQSDTKGGMKFKEEFENKLDELQARVLKDEVTIETLTEKNMVMKEQASRHAAQLQEYRNEINEKNERVEELETKSRELEDQSFQESNDNKEISDRMADLKIKLSEKEKILENTEKQMAKVEFEMGNLKDENNRLQTSFNKDGRLIGELEEINKQLKEVIAEKETIINDLNFRVDSMERNLQIYQDDEKASPILQDARKEIEKLTLESSRKDQTGQDLKSQISSLNQSFTSKVEEMKRVNKNLNDELEKINKESCSKEEFARLKGDLDRLQEENTELKEQVQAQSGLKGYEEVAGLKKEVKKFQYECENIEKRYKEVMGKLAAENKSLKEQLQNVEEKTSQSEAVVDSGGMDNELLKKLKILYSDVNDVVSQMRMNVQVVKDNFTDLEDFFKTLSGLNIVEASEDQKKQLKQAIDNIDPDEMVGSILDTLEVNLKDIERLKAIVKDLREYL